MAVRTQKYSCLYQGVEAVRAGGEIGDADAAMTFLLIEEQGAAGTRMAFWEGPGGARLGSEQTGRP
ncbi:hypothetical protein Shyhy02_54540 [Streptomyces hygroscopicus subsp. hygroscopicus]|nr:hypothetical protein Shyhy02_54540 [Streptomyces hygroscopicus subsp. hygroscopicus]